jgi:hypothetical protein
MAPEASLIRDFGVVDAQKPDQKMFYILAIKAMS